MKTKITNKSAINIKNKRASFYYEFIYILTTLPLEDFYLHHREQRNDITIAAIPYNVAVPYAILTTDGSDSNRVTALEEKPCYGYYANAGIYIISNDLLSGLPEGERTDTPDLIEKAIGEGRRVGYLDRKSVV